MKLSYAIEPGGLSEQHHAEIFELHERKWSSGRIAQHLRKHPGTVAWFMYSRGLKAPAPAVSRTYVRKGLQVRTFSAEDDAFMVALRVQNFELREIAELITKRTGHPYGVHTVHNRLVMLSARDEVDA